MLVIATLLFAVAEDSGMRGILFVLIVLAILLILAGGVVALFTYFYQRKAQVINTDQTGE